MDKTASKPMPCPFCGEVPGIYHPGNGVIIQCKASQCDVQAETWAWTERDALDQWNRRSPSEPQAMTNEVKAAVERAAKLLDETFNGPQRFGDDSVTCHQRRSEIARIISSELAALSEQPINEKLLAAAQMFRMVGLPPRDISGASMWKGAEEKLAEVESSLVAHPAPVSKEPGEAIWPAWHKLSDQRPLCDGIHDAVSSRKLCVVVDGDGRDEMCSLQVRSWNTAQGGSDRFDMGYAGYDESHAAHVTDWCDLPEMPWYPPRKYVPTLTEARGAEDETVPKSVLDKLMADWNAETDTELCSVSEMCKILADELSAIIRKHTRHTHAPGEGWQWVPKEPTPEMKKAGWDTGVYHQYRGWGQKEYDPIDSYKAMLAAAPATQEDEP